MRSFWMSCLNQHVTSFSSYLRINVGRVGSLSNLGFDLHLYVNVEVVFVG